MDLSLFGTAGVNDTDDTTDTTGLGLDMSALAPLLLQSAMAEQQQAQQAQSLQALQLLNRPVRPLSPIGQVAEALQPLALLSSQRSAGASNSLKGLMQIAQLAAMSRNAEVAKAKLAREAALSKIIEQQFGGGVGSTTAAADGRKLSATIGPSGSSITMSETEPAKTPFDAAIRAFRREKGREPTEAEAELISTRTSPFGRGLEAMAGAYGEQARAAQIAGKGYEVKPDGTVQYYPDAVIARGAIENIANIDKFTTHLGMLRDLATKDPGAFGGWPKLKNALAGAGFQFEEMRRDVRDLVTRNMHSLNRDERAELVRSPYFKNLYKKGAVDAEVMQSVLVFEAAGALYGQTGRGLSDRDAQAAAQLIGAERFFVDPRSVVDSADMLVNMAASNKRVLESMIRFSTSPQTTTTPTPLGPMEKVTGPAPAATPKFSQQIPASATRVEAGQILHDVLIENSPDYQAMTVDQRLNELKRILDERDRQKVGRAH